MYFTRNPLNFNNYIQRLSGLDRYVQRNRHLLPSILADCIVANRTLQRAPKNVSVRRTETFDIKVQPSGAELEDTLWNVLKKYRKEVVQSDALVAKYMLTEPRPHKAHNLLSLVAENLDFNLQNRQTTPPRRKPNSHQYDTVQLKKRKNQKEPLGSETDGNSDPQALNYSSIHRSKLLVTPPSGIGSKSLTGVVRGPKSGLLGDLPLNLRNTNILLNLLLQHGDYHNTFKLLDLTTASPQYLKYRQNKLKQYFWIAASANCALLTVQYFFLPQISLMAWCMLNFCAIALVCGLLPVSIIRSAGRVSFRSRNSLMYKWMHQDEFLMINKILLHFEEFNEVNVRNFHHVNVREYISLNNVAHGEWTIEGPTASQEIASLNAPTAAQDDPHILQLQQLFRDEIQKRRMVINELSEELIFLQYWLDHGEQYKWVEPDQDPAEIVRLYKQDEGKRTSELSSQ